jgi:hypothetical protein
MYMLLTISSKWPAGAAPLGKVRKCALPALILFLCAASTGVAGADGPTASAVVSSSASITLDGRLDESVWLGAPLLKLIQQSPKPGEPTPYETEVRVVVAKDRIYFGFVCKDPDPSRVAIHTMRRDGEMKGDDSVSIVLDTYGDRRTGYFFQINAAGARVDGLISDPESVSLDWDGIWDARVAKMPDGWSAEIVIPSRTLSFSPGVDQWGLNLERYVARERLTSRWSSSTLDSNIYDLSRSGWLAGVGTLAQGKGLEFVPYATSKTSEVFPGSHRSWQGSAGGDVTWKITPQMVTVFTANTDFAETEVDAQQINLTRFPLFFPEKRAFFLEGANQYNFGPGMGADDSAEFIPFFSRRIGLLGGAQIPINGGVKLNGRVGNWNLALLDVQTRKTFIPSQVAQDLALSSPLVRSTNLLAGRVSYDFNKNLRVGTIFTNGDPEGLRQNTLAGVDVVWRTSKFRGDKNFLVGGWTATTQGDLGPGSKIGWGFTIDYPNDLWNCTATVNQYGDALDPLLGFLPRPGVRLIYDKCFFQPRPSKDGPFRWIRQEFLENRYWRYTNSRGIVESWEYRLSPVHVQLESGESFELGWDPQGETLETPFEVAPGVVIPPGSYNFTRWRIEGATSVHRPLQFGMSTFIGTFYNGHLTQWTNYLRWTSPRGKVQLDLDTENDFGHLPAGNFVKRLWSARAAYAWNPNIILSSFVQYDTESQNIGTDTRVRWTITPGNDLFVVWNRGWQRIVTDPHVSIVPENDLIAIKLRWTFRL